MMTIDIHYGYDENGEKLFFSAPAHYVVCWRCHGTGKHDHPAFSDGISQDEMWHEWDHEMREDYFNGVYDVPCSVCNGVRVVPDYDFEALPPEIQTQLEELWAEQRYEAAMRAAENRSFGY